MTCRLTSDISTKEFHHYSPDPPNQGSKDPLGHIFFNYILASKGLVAPGPSLAQKFTFLEVGVKSWKKLIKTEKLKKKKMQEADI